jgi:uncharacterized protein YndB with AHSA1/START domain
MADFDWSRFAVRINVKAPAEKLYWCWATREGIESWFLRVSDYRKPGGEARPKEEAVEKGDSYQWRWHGYPDEVTEKGEILDSNGKDRFQFRFGEAGICTVKIYEEEGENIVELVQEAIPTDEKGKQNWHIGCKTGWTFYMANLKSLLEGGIDLRNKNEKIQNVITA